MMTSTTLEVSRLRLDHITRTFPGVKALDDVTLDVGPGEVHGLIGENGAGKSTLMAIASGVLAPDSGSVQIDGREMPTNPSLARRLGLAIVHQEPALMPDLTVAENIYLGVSRDERPAGKNIAKWAESQLQLWSSDTGIAPNDRVNTLNPEQRFVVELVKALAQKPSVLILDEPTEHLAAEDVDRLFGHIEALKSAGSSVIYISHRIPEVRQVADRITVLRDGKATGTFPTETLTERQIIDLIVGRALDTAFPAKAVAVADPEVGLSVSGLEAHGLEPLDLRVAKGQILGLAGIIGNGQDVLMRSLAGLRPAKGDLQVGGSRGPLGDAAASTAAGIRYIPGDRHEEGIFPGLSVRENFSVRALTLLSRAGIVSRSREEQAVAKAIRQYAIKTPGPETAIGSLSGGNQQKTVLAGVLASAPAVLLAHEPTQGVDVGARLDIYEALRGAAEQGATVIVLSTNTTELAGLCDRVLVFSRGEVAADLRGDDVNEGTITSSMMTSTRLRNKSSSANRGLAAWLGGHTAPWAIAAGVTAILGILAVAVNPTYFSELSIFNLLMVTATVGMAAIAQQFVMMTGGIDLSIGPLMGFIVVFGSFFFTEGSSVLTQAYGWVAIVVVALLVGLVNWTLIEGAGLHPMIATLVTYMTLQASSLLLRPAPDGLYAGGFLDAVGGRVGWVPVAFLIAAALAVGLELALFRTQVGIGLRGLGSRLEAARSVGIRPRLMTLYAYLSCSLIAALAGVLLSYQIGIGDATVGASYTLSSIAAVVIGGGSLFGGRGSFIGAMLGALLLSQLVTVSNFMRLSNAWQLYLLGGITIVAVAFYARARKAAVIR